jgi:MFS family permease
MSVYRAGFLVGGIVGPALGGAVLGWSLRAPFFLYAGTLVLAGLAGLLLLPRERTPSPATVGAAPSEDDPAAPPVTAPESDEPRRTTVREAFAAPGYRAALAGNFAVGFALLGVRSTLVPLLVVTGLGLSPGWVGVAFLASSLVQTVLLLPAGRAVDRIGRRQTLVAGGLVCAVALVVLATAYGPVSLMLSMGLFGAGSAILGVAPAALVGDVVQGRGGTAVAVFQMSSDLGSILGPLLAGLLIDHASFTAALLVSAVVVGASGLLGLTVPRTVPAPPPVPPQR